MRTSVKKNRYIYCMFPSYRQISNYTKTLHCASLLLQIKQTQDNTWMKKLIKIPPLISNLDTKRTHVFKFI